MTGNPHDLQARRAALRERAASERLAMVATVATLRERVGAVATILGSASSLFRTGRALLRLWRRGRGGGGGAAA